MAASVTSTQADKIIDDKLLEEERLYAELESEDIPSYIREARLQEFKKNAEQVHQLKEKQHGVYSEIEEEKKFLDMTTSEEFCIIHFFHPDFRSCAIMDTHLKKLSEKYFECKFAKISVDIAKFFVNKLKVKILPAVFCFKNGIVVDKIVGFDDFGGTESFQTSALEKRLSVSGVINCKDLDDSDNKKKSLFGFQSKNTTNDDSDSDGDW